MCQPITVYTTQHNLHNVMCGLYLSKARRKIRRALTLLIELSLYFVSRPEVTSTLRTLGEMQTVCWL